MMNSDAHLRRLVGGLVASGELSADWVEAFLSVRRHEFIPDVVWRHDPDGDDLVPVRRRDDPAGWLQLAYANDALATQVDDGQPGPGQVGRTSTSSASQPSVVALMLAALELEPGIRVCEIGTGTGYNAALLAHRIGAGNLTTIEIDPDLATRAARTLERHGLADITVSHSDGALGYPQNAPYDRVIATAAVYDVPYPWVAQTRPGGRILTPWRTEYYNGGLLRLTRHDDGSATGGIIGNVAFMPLRAQRQPAATINSIVQAGTGGTGSTTSTTSTDLHPYNLVRDPAASLAIGLRVPRCDTVSTSPHKGAVTTWFLDQWSDSWAVVEYTRGARQHPVRQHGPRRLFDEVRAAYQAWQDAGRPGYRFVVTQDGQRVEPGS